jgi:hypothetical protein
MKLEHIFNETIFLAPKVYRGITDYYEYIKIKGLQNPITFEELKALLIKDQTITKFYLDILSELNQ